MWLCCWHGDQITAKNEPLFPQNTLSSLIENSCKAHVLTSKHMLKHFKA